MRIYTPIVALPYSALLAGFALIGLDAVGAENRAAISPQILQLESNAHSQTQHFSKNIKQASKRNEEPAFDPGLANLGKELHAQILTRAKVDHLYQTGSLFGAVTKTPKVSIAVPIDDWQKLEAEDREKLKHYAASLVPEMRTQPLRYCQSSVSAPLAKVVRDNAKAMGPRSWVIHGGRLKDTGPASMAFDILTDQVVASGEQKNIYHPDGRNEGSKDREIGIARSQVFKEALARTGDWDTAKSLIGYLDTSIAGQEELIIEFLELLHRGSEWTDAESRIALRATRQRE